MGGVLVTVTTQRTPVYAARRVGVTLVTKTCDSLLVNVLLRRYLLYNGLVCLQCTHIDRYYCLSYVTAAYLLNPYTVVIKENACCECGNVKENTRWYRRRFKMNVSTKMSIL